jgi:DNA-binding CsgD family transcriptional regulator
VLTGGARDLPTRQQTIRDTIAWSHQLLTPAEQRLFACLGVFVGGWTIPAAEAICAVDDLDTLDGMQSLVDKSLVRQIGTVEPRFTMLETIREYALEQLELSGEADTIRRRHVAYFREMAATASANIVGPREQHWLDRLDAEHDNLRAVLRRLLLWEEVDAALSLAGSLRIFWQVRGYLIEGRQWLDRALAAAAGAPPALRVRVLTGAGWLAVFQEDLARGKQCFEEALPLAMHADDAWALGDALRGLGYLAREDGDGKRMERYMGASLAESRARGDLLSETLSLIELARTREFQGDMASGIALKREALALFRKMGSVSGTAMLLGELGRFDQAAGDDEHAIVLYQESLLRYREIGWFFVIHDGLVRLAAIAARRGQVTVAARLWGAAETLRETRRLPRQSRYLDVLYTHALPASRNVVDQASWEAAYNEGRAMPLDEAIALALAMPARMEPTELPPQSAASPTTHPYALTTREVEVLQLVAAGLTSRQVAERLHISPNTVNVHLAAIYGKLGVSSRTAATRFALDHALI